VQHVLTAFEDTTITDNLLENVDEAWKHAVKRKPITRLRSLIRALHASGKWHEAFLERIRSGNAASEFVDPEACEQGDCNI